MLPPSKFIVIVAIVSFGTAATTTVEAAVGLRGRLTDNASSSNKNSKGNNSKDSDALTLGWRHHQ